MPSHDDLIRKIQSKRTGADVQAPRRGTGWLYAETEQSIVPVGSAIISKDMRCPHCEAGIVIKLAAFNNGVHDWIPQDICPGCGAGKPFVYRWEL